MSNLWERFDSIATPDEVNDAKAQFAPIEEGVYRAILEEIQPAESKNGLPMLKGKFKMVDGGRFLFYNQNLQNMQYPNLTAVNIAEAIVFISALMGEEVEFTGLRDLGDTVLSIPTGEEYSVKVTYGKKDTDRKFPKLEIIEETGIFEDVEVLTDEEIPF